MTFRPDDYAFKNRLGCGPALPRVLFDLALRKREFRF